MLKSYDLVDTKAAYNRRGLEQLIDLVNTYESAVRVVDIRGLLAGEIDRSIVLQAMHNRS